MRWFRRWGKRILVFTVIGLVVAALVTAAANLFVILSTRGAVISPEAAAELDADCVLVLGSWVWSDTRLSKLLEDRVATGLSLYESGAAKKLLLSGDHGRKAYDEVNAMRLYMQDHGVRDEDIFLDHAGFNTYDSMYRARDVFEVDTVIIVTQRFHMSRALYIARSLGLTAYGVVAEPNLAQGSLYNDLREVPARVKDVVQCILRPGPKYLGPAIPISGNGTVTFDE